MAPIRLAIVGCGGMGHRHLYGLIELHRAGWEDFTLVGACDPVRANAESLAEQAAEYFGSRPSIVGSLDQLAALGVEAVDVTTTPPSHHSIATETLGRGWHTMVEKPLGLTVRACHVIQRAAQASGCVLSVAENYRRDPVNRLARALLEAGAIGAPRLLLHLSIGGGDQMIISVWRHQKDQSGLLLDVGVHYADMIEYLLGEVELVYAQTRLHERIRKNPAATGDTSGANPAGVYGRWQKEMPATFEATAEDAAYATLVFKQGMTGQYIEDHAGHGQPLWARQIYGSAGSISLPVDRSGERISLQIAGQGEIHSDELLELVPDFRLDAATASLFGAERLAGYSFSFAETDRKLIAVEYADFAGAIRGEHPPEVDAAQGTRSVALSYALLESGVAGRPVTVAEVLAEQVGGYQRSIDQGLDLV
jgi:predicted dehydrogenase